MHISLVVAVSISIFTMIVIFSHLLGKSLSENTQTTMAQIPAILQENDKHDEQKNLKMTDHVRIDPLDAIVTATKNISAQPSDLRSIALEPKLYNTESAKKILEIRSRDLQHINSSILEQGDQY